MDLIIFGKITADKGLFFVSLCVIGFLSFVILDYYIFHSDFFSIQIFRALGELTILLLLFIVQPALFVFSIYLCKKENFRIKTYSFWSFIILLVSNSFFFGSFIFLR